MKISNFAIGFVFFCLALPVNAAVVTLDSSTVTSTADDGQLSNAVGVNTGTADGYQLVTALDGSSASYTGRNYEITETEAHFDINFDHVRNGLNGSIATSTVDIYFTANGNYTYSLSGEYSSNSANKINSFVHLYKVDPSALLFLGLSSSLNTPDESFTLGLGGGETNFISGTLTGSIESGAKYRLFFENFIQAVEGDSGALASGNVKLSISSVPLPAAAWLFGSALLGLGWARRSRRQQGKFLCA